MWAALQTLASKGPALGRRAPILLAPSFAGGAGLYMSLASEPGRWPAIAGLLAMALASVLAWRFERLRWPALWLFAAGVGFVWCMVHTDLAASPRLEREMAGEVTGIATWVEAAENRPRIVLRDVTFRARRAVQALDRVRLRIAGGDRPIVGDRVKVRAILRPPPRPAAPGGYDFQRAAYFKHIGAVGFAIGKLEATQAIQGGGPAQWIAHVRAGFRDQVYQALSDRPNIAGIIAALTVGDRSGVTEADSAALRASGLAHLLAISGLHLGLAAGVIFFAIRLLLALPHGAALRFPIHKIAAIGAILAAAGYLAMSGTAPPAQRAFVMATAGMVAVLTDRLRSGLWFVAWAAVIVIAVSPDVVVGPSFQLSFAAVIAIVAAYDAAIARRRREEFVRLPGGGIIRSVGVYMLGIGFASLIATCATAPLALAHFQQAPAYGVVANLAAMPLMAFLIMPAGIAAALFSLIGLGEWPFELMALGVELVLAAAYMVQGWEGGLIRTPASPGWVVAAFMGGGVLICALRGRVRWVGAPAVLAALIGLATVTPPDILVDERGRIAAVRTGDTLYFTSLRRGKFEQKVWTRFLGISEISALYKSEPEIARCDGAGCVIIGDAATVAISMAPHGLVEDCQRADFIIALYRASAAQAVGCAASLLIIDASALEQNGAHAVWIKDGKIKIRSVADAQGDRLWARMR